jgi:hypothetical protein
MNTTLNSLKKVVARAEYGVDPAWLQIAITEIETLRTENLRLAHLLMSPLVYVHETIITDVDKSLEQYIGVEE